MHRSMHREKNCIIRIKRRIWRNKERNPIFNEATLTNPMIEIVNIPLDFVWIATKRKALLKKMHRESFYNRVRIILDQRISETTIDKGRLRLYESSSVNCFDFSGACSLKPKAPSKTFRMCWCCSPTDMQTDGATTRVQLTGDPKLWPISWARVTWETVGGTCLP